MSRPPLTLSIYSHPTPYIGRCILDDILDDIIDILNNILYDILDIVIVTPPAHPISYLIFVVFFTRTKFLENKIYTEKTRKLRPNTQKIANFLRYYGKIHIKLPVFRVKSVKIYTGQKKFTRTCSWGS